MRYVSLFLLGFLAALSLAACTQPYSSPIIVREPGQQPTANFAGLKDLIVQGAAPDAPAQVLWTHGMCSHDDSWAYDRIGRIEAVLGVPAVIRPPYKETNQPYYINATFNTLKGGLTITFLIWSPMTSAYKSTLDFDKPGTNGDVAFPYTRAMLNRELKTWPDERLPLRCCSLFRKEWRSDPWRDAAGSLQLSGRHDRDQKWSVGLRSERDQSGLADRNCCRKPGQQIAL